MLAVRLSRWTRALCLLTAAWSVSQLNAQVPVQLRWQRIGGTALYANGPGVATGPVQRVWYANEGRTLYVRGVSGATFATTDFENWKGSSAVPPARAVNPTGVTVPEPDAAIIADGTAPNRLFAAGRAVYRSEDGGHTWSNLTTYRQKSILGGAATDVAIAPGNPDEITVASETGVWRSVDGGATWAGLNQTLPNLPIRRLSSTPVNGHGLQALFSVGAAQSEMEWMPGEKQGWTPATTGVIDAERTLADLAEAALGARPAAVALSGSVAYAGAAGGRLWYSLDAGRSWQRSAPVDGGAPESFYIDPAQPGTALVVLGPRAPDSRRSRVLRTINSGVFWDDLTDNLPDAVFHGITADRTSGIVYVAGDRGVYYTRADLLNAGPATAWTLISNGLPPVPALDVRLDPAGNQLFVALSGYGVYATAALRSRRDVRAVSAADLRTAIAAPGALVSVLGPGLQSTRLGDLTVPVLANSDNELQIQVPFNAPNGTLPLAVESASGPITLQMQLQGTSPVIFQDPDGSPWLLNAETGTLLDAQHPVRAGARIQILCTGLGRVRPQWPAGVAAPLSDPPQVTAPLRVRLGDTLVEVTRATLAPGYVGYYLVEAVLPLAMNAGPTELWLESEGRTSNRVQVYLEP